MSLILKDRCKQRVAVNAGTNSITLTTAVTGFRTISSVLSNGDSSYFCLESGSSWEVFIGTYTSSTTTISRDTVLASSNGGSKINLGTSITFCYIAYPADKAVYRNTANEVVVPSEGFRFSDNTTQITSPTAAIALKADIASPTFTGTPSGPTATVGSNTTQLATTSFVSSAIAAVDLSVYALLPDILPVAGTMLSYGGSRQLAAGGTVTHGGALTITGQSRAASFGVASGAIELYTGETRLLYSSTVFTNIDSGRLDIAIGGVGQIRLGGTGSSHAGIYNSGTTTKFRTADNSADAPITCGAITASGHVQLSNASAGYIKNAAGGLVSGWDTDGYYFGNDLGVQAGAITIGTLGSSLVCSILQPTVFRGNSVTIRNGLTPTQLQLHSTYTSSTSFACLDQRANSGGTAYEISSFKGSAGGANLPINVGHRNSAGTFTSALSIATTGAITASDYIYGTSAQFSALGAFGGYGVGSATLAVQALNSSTIGMNIRGQSGQTADLLKCKTSANTDVFTVGPTGAITASGAVKTDNLYATNWLKLSGTNQTTQGIAVRNGGLSLGNDVAIGWSTTTDPTANQSLYSITPSSGLLTFSGAITASAVPSSGVAVLSAKSTVDTTSATVEFYSHINLPIFTLKQHPSTAASGILTNVSQINGLNIISLGSGSAFGSASEAININSGNMRVGYDGSGMKGYVGTYLAAGLSFYTNTVERLSISSTGAITASGQISCNTLNAGTGNIANNGASTVYIGSISSYFFASHGDGVVELCGASLSGSGFGRLQLGGTTSSFPAIKRSGTTTAFRLADDSADGPITCGDINGNSLVSNNYNLAVGYSTAPSLAFGSMAVGWTARATHSYSIALGTNAATSAANQLQIGSGTNVNQVRFGDGTGAVTWTNPLTVSGAITVSGNLTLSDVNVLTGTTTGTIFATTSSQKQAWWGATPIVQPTTSVAAATLVSNGGTALTDTDTFDGYTLKQIVKALRIAGLLA